MNAQKRLIGEIKLAKWEILFTKSAQQDAKKLHAAHLKQKALTLLDIIRNDPFSTPPSYEKLTGDLTGMYSRRINIKHRLVYTVNRKIKIITVLRMWSHYE